MPLLDLLQSRSRQICEDNRDSAVSELKTIFPEPEWGVQPDFNYFTDPNFSNIWKNELRRRVRSQLEEHGVGQQEYSDWLGDVHFVNIAIYREGLFNGYRSNAGWRIVLMSLPRVGAIVLGLASHYQNAQNHGRLGAASNLMYDVADKALQSDERPHLAGRKISANDWDQTGLFPSTISNVAAVDISPNVLLLKETRTTTLKKILASFITVKVLPASTSQAELHQELTEIRSTAEHLSANVYPFTSLEEFEAFRALALQDLAAASTRLLLRQRSSTRSIVRVYYGPPGTGKTLAAVREAVKIVDPGFDGDVTKSFAEFNDRPEQCAFVTFHPSLQYEDVVESIRPVISQQNGDSDENDEESSGQLAYKIHEGIFLRMIRRALESPEKEFVLVIDEINRGDVSRILGPLISSLEADKRIGAEFPIGIELQHPRAEELESRLFMPSNLHFIGTMNSSDRNIALVDHALRRRFDFIHVPPEPALLGITNNTNAIDCKKLLDSINARIEHLLDADHCIGHGYFMGCESNETVIERLATKVIPLLREYFYGNEGMILMVLGCSTNASENIFELVSSEIEFSRLFSVSKDAAASLGYRPHNTPRSLRLDPRFWNSTKLIPGPEDEDYAVRCVLNIYSAAHTTNIRSQTAENETPDQV